MAMMNSKKRLRSLMVLPLAGLMVACGSAAGDEESSATVSEQDLRLTATSDIPSMDITAATDLVSFTAMNNAFEGLYTLDLDGKAIPASAADMPEISEDGLVYTFTIRDDAVWSNGDPVTSSDYVYAWQKMVDSTVAAGYAYMYDGLIQNATEIIAGE